MDKDKYISLLEKENKELEKQVSELKEKLQNFPYRPLDRNTIRINPSPGYTTTPLPFIVTCQHEYENPWFGIYPPPCKKCGQAAWQPLIVTSGTATITLNDDIATSTVVPNQPKQ